MTSEAELTASEISALEWPKIPASSLSAISEKFAIIVTTETLMIIFFVSSTDIKLFFSLIIPIIIHEIKTVVKSFRI